ncbi:hypothetical protein [Chthonomonas calidirosea]|uniref:hypothetical protein n=1 Tax=Chthonomonas calidirosea TaxID=454171 RepID=UPI0006ECA6DF|nr:hypothetical protein [Chthonomonas calidirosea]CEK15323.1 hypothetical protein CP488_01130 [Chthonomonas calidirosea]
MAGRSRMNYISPQKQRSPTMRLFLNTLLFILLGTSCFLLGFFVLSRYIPTGKGPDTPNSAPVSQNPLPTPPQTSQPTSNLPTSSTSQPVQQATSLPGATTPTPPAQPTNNGSGQGAGGPIVIPSTNASAPNSVPQNSSALPQNSFNSSSPQPKSPDNSSVQPPTPLSPENQNPTSTDNTSQNGVQQPSTGENDFGSNSSPR